MHPHGSAACGDAFVAALKFFDMYYLTPCEEEDWDPYFYDFTPVETAPFQWEIDRASVMHRAVAAVGPRGSGKTMRRMVRMMMQFLSRPAWSYIYCTSEQGLAGHVGQRMMDQLYNNPRIQDDWGPEYGVTCVKPKRGDLSTGKEHFSLVNRSYFMARTATGRQRGGRPARYLLDDPEFDRKPGSSPEAIRDWMNTLIFRVIMPMLQRPGMVGIDWVGTFVSRRHYLWSAMESRSIVTPDGEVQVAVDPRFNSWHRMLMPAAIEDDEGKLQSCWPAMWPVDDEQKARLVEQGRTDPSARTLVEIREDVGENAFDSEYMAKDGSAGGSYFPVLTEEQHGWWLDRSTMDQFTDTMPWNSETRLCFMRDGKEVRIKLKDLIRECPIFITNDIAYTGNADSDRNVAMCQALTPENELICLDVWSQKCGPGILPIESMRMADRWRAGSIHPEAIRGGNVVATELNQLVATQASDVVGVTHLPVIRPFNPGLTDKTSKIASPRWRFEHGKAKFPLARMKWATDGWGRLYQQICDFNPEMQDGGLAKDDEIDAWCMHQFVVKGLPDKYDRGTGATATYEERCLRAWDAGERLCPETGQPLYAIIGHLLTPEQVDAAVRPENKSTTRNTLEVG